MTPPRSITVTIRVIGPDGDKEIKVSRISDKPSAAEEAVREALACVTNDDYEVTIKRKPKREPKHKERQ